VSVATVKVIVALVLVAHGLGHALGTLPVFGMKLSREHSADSWLISKFLGDGPARGLCVIIHTLALLVFGVAGSALAGWGFQWVDWEAVTVLGAILSLSALLLFWHAFPFFFPNKVGVIPVNVLALLGILVLRWPPALFGG